MAYLPLIKEKTVSIPHFPTAMQALIFRCWDMVPCARLGCVLKTDAETVRALAFEMGLKEQNNTDEWVEKGYISILRSVWDILPYEQILELLNWSEERLSFVLKEDDFLYVKFGFFKFDCKPVLYRPLTREEHEGAARIKKWMERYVYPLDCEDAAKPFDFWNDVYKKSEGSEQQSFYFSDTWCVKDYTNNEMCALYAKDFKADLQERFSVRVLDKADAEILLYLDLMHEEEEYHEVRICENKIVIHAASAVGILRGLNFILNKAKSGNLKIGTFKRVPVIKTRFIYSFCGLYSDCLDRDISVSFPDSLLKKYAECGINGVWIQGVFSKLAPYPFDESLCRNWKRRMENLRLLTGKAARYGIKVYLYVNEPRCMPQEFFIRRPDLKGRTYYEGTACLCTSNAEVRDYLVKTVTHICEEVPLLGGFFNISMSENLTHCYSRKMTEADEPCPICSKKKPEDVTADVISLLANAVFEAAPNMQFFVLTWAWERLFSAQQIEHLIKQLPKKVVLMNVSENDMPFEKGGVSSNVMDYTLSMPGPSPWSENVWRMARENGLQLGAKVQLNNSWECSTAPFLPVYETVVSHLDALKSENVQHLMLSWTLGGYPSETISLVSSYFFADLCEEQADAYEEVLKETYGSAADQVKKAVHCFSKGFAEFPFSIETLYYGPQNLGAANLLYLKPTCLSATMTCWCYDDLKAWCGPYSPEVLKKQFEKVCKEWEKGIGLIADMPDSMFKDMAYYGYTLFKSSYNQVSFILNRGAAERAEEQRKIIKDELKLAQNVYSIMQRTSALGYEAANHYYVHKAMLREKIISCAQMLISGEEAGNFADTNIYVDLKANDGAGAIGFFKSKGKVIFCGSEVYAMDKSEKSGEYETFAKENDIRFLFDDFIPEVPFYTVPYTSIAALTSDGGFIASVGKPFDLYDKMEIVYIAKNRKCFLITEDSTKFLSLASHWRDVLTPYDKIEFFDSKADAEKKYMIEDIPRFQNEI